MKADEIEVIVSKLIELNKKNVPISQIDQMEEFAQFREENSLFYKTALSNDMDLVIFKQMMKMKRKLEDGEDQYGVDVKFGKYMADKFIEPVIGKKNN